MSSVERKSAVLYDGRITVDFTPGNHRYKVQGIDKFDWLPSVTAVTGMLDKPALVPWATKMAVKHLREWIETRDHREASKDDLIALFEEAGQRHERERKRAAEIGDQVHRFNEAYGLGLINGSAAPALPEECEPEVMLGIKAFTDWVVQVKPKFVAAEKIVCSVKHGYTGIIDSIQEIPWGHYRVGGRIVLIKGGKYIVDYKTSKGIWPEAYIQTAAYQHAHQEESGDTLAGRIILRLDKETGDVHFALVEGKKAFQRDFKTFACLLAAKRQLRALESDLKRV